MAGPLITFSELTKRPGFDGVVQSEAEAVIDDVSALVRDIAETDFLNEAGEVVTPPALVLVVVSMVRRGLKNPYGRSSEDIGDASWQGMGSIYPTRREKAIIRRAGGTLGAGEVTLEGYLPLSPEFRLADSDDLTGSL